MQPAQANGNNMWNRDDASFEDSERFEEDSQASLDDSIDDSQQNWRGWTDCQTNCDAIQPGLSCVVYQYHNASGRFSSASTRTVVQADPNTSSGQHPMMSRGDNPVGTLLTLSEIAARVCAEKWSFQQLEEFYAHICMARAAQMKVPPPATTIPEKIFLSFIVHCFPQSTDEIRMYSTLANGSSEQYEFGKTMYEWGNVRDVSQTGFLLSGHIRNTVQDARQDKLREQESFYVTVKVDRCRIVECTCECSNRSSWCKHVVALCIYRIFERSQIKFKETIADAINSMTDNELRRLVQWHINEIPRKCIPGFQKLIDQIKDPHSTINSLPGAPDPTDGGHDPVSRFDFPEIENKVRRLLCRYCVPAPAVHCDVHYLSTSPHPTHAEWTTIIKPLRGRDPEGMWNLLQMIREMFARNDENAVALLRTITDECLANNQVLLWWYISKLVESGHWMNTTTFKVPAPQQLLVQLNCAQLCDEVVILWKLVAMNPRAGNSYRAQLAAYLQDYHRTAVARLKNMISLAPPITDEVNQNANATVLSNHQTSAILQTVLNIDVRYPLSGQNMKFNLSCFPGFYPAIQMCHYLNEQDIRLGLSSDAIFYVAAPNFQNSYKLVPPTKEKILKKKKKKKKMMRKRLDEGGSLYGNRREDEYQGLDGIWRILPDVQNATDGNNDSTESGQESDIQKAPQRLEMPRKRKIDSVEMDVNEVLAAAFTPLETLEARFLRVEAYGTHGYRADAIECALKVVDYLIDSLAEQSNEFCQVDKLENSSSNSKLSSSSSSAVSDEVTVADREEEVVNSNRFLSTMEKILYVTKVLKDSANLQHTVFDIALRSLSVTKYPLFTKHQQIVFSYYEMEFVAILDQLWQSVPMDHSHMEKIRSKAQNIIATDAGNNGELPPIALTKFLFLALYWTESSSPSNQRPGPNAPAAASPALQQNRRLLLPTDSDLALQCALNVLGCRPLVPEKYIIHWETIRRDKSELACLLLTRYKDSQERCALVIDQLLDPKLHRIYPHHLSNASYLLEHCPVYRRHFKPGQRPTFPYKQDEDNQEKDEIVSDYKAQIEEQLESLTISALKPGKVRRKRGSDEDPQSSSPSENEYSANSSAPSTSRSEDSVDSSPAHMPGLTKENRATIKSLHKTDNSSTNNRKSKKRAGQVVDPRYVVSDAHVYHMHELARKIVNEAGGQQNTVIWGNPVVGGTNRRLHLCAIIIGVYALGMSNRISPSWNTRTYSCIASWVASQVQEVGAQGIEVIREIWMAHFTPNEIAVIAERASPSSDPPTKQEAAKLALSVLPFAHALSDDEVISALNKCRAESREMLVEGLLAMDTPQYRQIGRARTLFATMQHWHDLSYDIERERNQPPAGMVVNPYANSRFAQMNAQQHANRLPNRQNPQQLAIQNNQQGQNNAVAQVPPGIPAAQLASYLYPQSGEMLHRLHQSHSAPQLGGIPGDGERLAGLLPSVNLQSLAQLSPASSILNAYHYGMRAMDCMATSPGEEKQMYLKFGPHPPYQEDLNCLYNLAKQLGGHYLLNFYTNACRSVISPFILHQYATESIHHFPVRMYGHNPQPVRMLTGPVPLMSQNLVPILQQPPTNVRYPNVKFSIPGQITNLFIAHGYQQITGELFERCCEQYLQGIINKMNSPKFAETNNVENQEQFIAFITNAHDAFKWIPSIGYQLFEDFVRVFKRQKTYRKEFGNSVNACLSQLCNHGPHLYLEKNI